MEFLNYFKISLRETFLAVKVSLNQEIKLRKFNPNQCSPEYNLGQPGIQPLIARHIGLFIVGLHDGMTT